MPGAWAQIDHELEVIGALGFAGYFLIVWDIVEFCRRQDIYCQGRGSAANSAVCYALGITNVDAVSLGLLFERFLSPERDGPPDIDVDIESGRREEVIQYVYERYGRHCAAQVANVITYRARSAIRDVGKALGHSPEEVDAWAKAVDRGEPLDRGGPLPPLVGQLAARDPRLPPPPRPALGRDGDLRPAGDRGVPGGVGAPCRGAASCSGTRTTAPRPGWSSSTCSGWACSTRCTTRSTWSATATAREVDLALLDQEDAVYDMLCRADTVGVFQVESRAQMATLPRIRPRCFYDLVIEVALIRPGPIQGGSVHPYIRRRQGLEAPDPPHPLLERALEQTLGVPLFQEQLMQIAIDVAGFTPAEADELRQAMSAKRSGARMARLSERLFAGMAERGITGAVAEEIVDKLAAFANFGFPESHAVSFAYLVYSTAWFKLHYPAAFTAGLLNAQPMGFWSPQSLVADARRHGVTVRRPHVDVSGVGATLEWGLEPAAPDGGLAAHPGTATPVASPPCGWGSPRCAGSGRPWRNASATSAPYASVEDLVRRTGTGRPQLEALATAGALEGLAPRDGAAEMHGRRPTLWAAGALAHGTADRLPGLVSGEEAPPLPDLTPLEEVEADMWATGLTVGTTAVELARPRLDAMGVIPAGRLVGAETDGRVFVGGVVTHRQRPESAKGTVFLNLEDETGMVNVICSPGAWERWRSVARGVTGPPGPGTDRAGRRGGERRGREDRPPRPRTRPGRPGIARLPVVGGTLRNHQDALAGGRYPQHSRAQRDAGVGGDRPRPQVSRRTRRRHTR